MLIEQARVAPEVLAALRARGYTLKGLGEYGARPRVQAAGVDLSNGLRSAVSDPRTDYAALAARPRPSPREPPLSEIPTKIPTGG